MAPRWGKEDSLDGKEDSLDDVDAGCGLEVIPQGHTFGRLALADIAHWEE